MFLRIFFLAFLTALDIHAAKELYQVTTGSERSSTLNSLSSLRSEVRLPNSCEILAAEANKRLHRAGIWSRILIVRYSDQTDAHAYCVFQPSFQIVAYDDTGSVELATASRDAKEIARVLGKRKGRPIISGRFLE
jgi:hypothetical protein